MKLQTILILSVGLNVCLGAYALLKPSSAPVEARQARVEEGASAVAAKSGPRTVVRTEVVVDEKLIGWGALESEDYRNYIANLRTIGCPEDTIRDIIIADVNKLYAGRIAALYPLPKDFKWWEAQDRRGRRRGAGAEEDRARDEQVRELEKEKREVIKELLGVDMAQAMERWEGRPNEDDFRYGFLSNDKAEQLKTLRDKLRDQERDVWRNNEDLPEEERRAKFDALRRQGVEEMKQLLTQEEYDEYLLRNSGTARGMRERLASFEPSRDEFSEIFKLQNAFEEQYGGRRGDDDASREARDQAREQLNQGMEALLGPERYQEYQLAQDERYRDIFEFTERNELSKDTAKAIYDQRKIAEDQRRQVLANESIAPEDKGVVLSALAEETRNSMLTTMGEEAFGEYARRDGRWIEGLASERTDRRRGGRGGRGGR